MPWGAAAAIAAGAIGSAIGGGEQSGGTQTQNRAPWSTQAGYLDTAFQNAQQNYDYGKGRGTYGGTIIAGPTQQTQQGIDYLTNTSNGQGAQLAQGVGDASLGALSAIPQYQQNAQQMFQQGGGALNGTAQNVLTNAANGQTAAMGANGVAGQGAQTGAVSNAQGILASTQGDTNAALRQAANGYVNSDVVQGTVDNALRDVSRNLNEETLPGLNARATAGGNLNSARAGAAEAVARRGAEDRAADVAAGIRQDAYNTGLQTALANQGQQQQTALGANQQIASTGTAMANTGEQARQFDTTSATGAAQSLGALDLQNRQLGTQTQLAANQQLGNAGQMGITGAQAASGLIDANGGRLLTAGQAQQQADQTTADAAYEQWNRQYAQNNQLLKDYYGIVGSQNWGSEGESSSTLPANPMGAALGGASTGMGLYNAAGGANGISKAWNNTFGGGASSTAAPTYGGLY